MVVFLDSLRAAAVLAILLVDRTDPRSLFAPRHGIRALSGNTECS